MNISDFLMQGKGNARSIKDISGESGNSVSEVINAVSEARRGGLPVCTSRLSNGSLGLYLAETEADLLRTISFMRHKIDRDEEVLADVIASYNIAFGEAGEKTI